MTEPLYRAGDWVKCERGHDAWRFGADVRPMDPANLGRLEGPNGEWPEAGKPACDALRCPVCGGRVSLEKHDRRS